MGFILHEFWSFLASVFGHWQTWLSGGGIGGFLVILEAVLSKIFDWHLSKRRYVYVFLVTFFLGSCFLSWVDKDTEARGIANSKSIEHEADVQVLKKTQDDYGSLQYSCNYQAGVADTLRKQNGDQQGTINNCQNQALKLLIPPALEITSHRLSVLEKAAKDGRPGAVFLLIPNKTVTPITLNVICNKDVDFSTIGVNTLAGFPSYAKTLIARNSFQLSIEHPEFSPRDPMTVGFVFDGAQGNNVGCTFVGK